jgi:hypothetical protein
MVEQRPSSLVVDIQSLGAFCDMVLLLLIEIRVLSDRCTSSRAASKE